MDKSAEENWETLSSRTVHKNPWFEVVEDEILLKPEGYKAPYFTVKAKPGVFALPFDGERLLMVNQYRHPLRRRVWSFPAGSCETADILQNAQKELKEETGFSAGLWTRLGEFASNTSLSGSRLHVYLAERLEEGNHEREGGETDMRMEFKTTLEIEKLILGGELVGSDTIAAYFLFKKHMEKKT